MTLYSKMSIKKSYNLRKCIHNIAYIMLGERYENYVDALDLVDLESLEARRRKLCLKFAIKAVNDHKHKNWFVPNSKAVSTRQHHEKYLPVFSQHKRFWKSPISYLTRLLNSDYK